MFSLKSKLNLLLFSSVCIIIFVLIYVDSYKLNSLLIGYDDNFVVKEVNVSRDEKVEDVNNTFVKTEDEDNNKVTLINNVLEVDKWVFPVSGNYLITTYYSSGHKAIDIYSYSGMGSPIVSANSGTVIRSIGGCIPGNLYCNGRGGNYIVVKHNSGNYYTVYMHLKDIYVGVGDKVGSGDVIGTMGNTGYVIPAPTNSNPYGGTHLHFCVYIGEPDRGGYAINPFDLY